MGSKKNKRAELININDNFISFEKLNGSTSSEYK